MQQEIESLSVLSHQNIVKMYEFGTIERDPSHEGGAKHQYILMELLPGASLWDNVCSEGPINEGCARFLFSQLISGVEYMHSAGYAHRDIKPQNLLLDHNLNLRIIDFGISTVLRGKDDKDLLRARVGTPAYMAPEILKGHAYNGAQIDLFATGVVLFFLLTQRMPFAAADPENDLLYRILISGNAEQFWNIHS